MAQKSPIDIIELKKSGLLDEDRFYRLLSEQCNYVDHKTAKDFYLGLVRLATKELRANGVIRLPLLGDFALVRQKDRDIGLLGNIQAALKNKYMLKFYPNRSWKEYFSKLAERPGLEGRLDPREKILGKIL